MNRFDFTPYRRSTVGFDRLFDLLENNARAQQSENYPPFNIERSGEDHYRITLAVAGFKDDEIEITAQQNLLLVAGNKQAEDNEGKQFLHMGIANRNFERRFELADFVRVENAALADGLLVIDLVREIPEAMRPQTIAINKGDNVTKIVDKRDKKEDKAAFFMGKMKWGSRMRIRLPLTLAWCHSRRNLARVAKGQMPSRICFGNMGEHRMVQYPDLPALHCHDLAFRPG